MFRHPDAPHIHDDGHWVDTTGVNDRHYHLIIPMSMGFTGGFDRRMSGTGRRRAASSVGGFTWRGSARPGHCEGWNWNGDDIVIY
jgi:hypothetical protein